MTSAVAEYNAERNGYFINFTIVEGDHYAFGKIGVETSIAGLDANNLTSTIRTRQGDRFSATELQRIGAGHGGRSDQSGYPFADVRPRIERDPTTGTFGVTYLVDEGQHLYVERINITGNDKTRDFVIRRELEFAEGDPFNRALVTQGKANIEGSRLLLQGRCRRRAGQRGGQGHPQHRGDRAVDRRLRRHGGLRQFSRASWANCRSPSATSSAAAST